jgi:hypothetical protein
MLEVGPLLLSSEFRKFTSSQTLEAKLESDVLSLNLERFANIDVQSNDSTTVLTDANFWELKGDIIRDKGSSGLWLYPAAVCTIPLVLLQSIDGVYYQGATVLALGLLPFVRGLPRGLYTSLYSSCAMK